MEVTPIESRTLTFKLPADFFCMFSKLDIVKVDGAFSMTQTFLPDFECIVTPKRLYPTYKGDALAFLACNPKAYTKDNMFFMREITRAFSSVIFLDIQCPEMVRILQRIN